MSNSTSLFPKQKRFAIFPCGQHEWCCLRADRLVCGFFVNRESAVRFAHREAPGSAEIVFMSDQGDAALPRAA